MISAMHVILKVFYRCRKMKETKFFVFILLIMMVPISDGPVMPKDWECLDGTLFCDEDNNPYIIFCYEWKQIGNGIICAMCLSHAVIEPVQLFDARGRGWTKNVHGADNYVIDSPFLWKMDDGSLGILWASHGEAVYRQAVAKVKVGKLKGCGHIRVSCCLIKMGDMDCFLKLGKAV